MPTSKSASQLCAKLLKAFWNQTRPTACPVPIAMKAYSISKIWTMAGYDKRSFNDSLRGKFSVKVRFGDEATGDVEQVKILESGMVSVEIDGGRFIGKWPCNKRGVILDPRTKQPIAASARSPGGVWGTLTLGHLPSFVALVKNHSAVDFRALHEHAFLKAAEGTDFSAEDLKDAHTFCRAFVATKKRTSLRTHTIKYLEGEQLNKQLQQVCQLAICSLIQLHESAGFVVEDFSTNSANKDACAPDG